MTLDKDILGLIRVDLNTALEEIAYKRGLAEFRAGKCTFDPISGSFVFKIEGVAKGGKDQAAARYDQLRALDPTLPKRGFQILEAGRTYTVVGANARGKKPIILRDAIGKHYRASESMVRAHANGRLR